MSDQNGTGSNGALPQMNVLGQYVKDLSFENPNAPRSLAPQQESPNISIQVNVNANQIDQSDFEVSLVIEGTAGEGAGLLFQFELNYAGLFRLVNIPPDDLHPIVMIECPRLLFPFARHIVADAVRNGGFPPLMLEPIDFVALYRQRIEAEGAPANLA